ncbi:protein YqbG [Bacillus sp. NPDC077027]|uniref:protein YqbG n=1 Tax=Bacillus sp. NPDC077027 TaxID=3390548 RepID=UPI003D08BA0A
MLISVEEVKAYSAFDDIKNRSDEQLTSDIIEAEAEIIRIVGHHFTKEKYQPLPEKAKIALLKMAQYFALINGDESMTKGYTSEKMGDYSYALANDNTVSKPNIYHLLIDFIEPAEVSEHSGSAQMRLRSL